MSRAVVRLGDTVALPLPDAVTQPIGILGMRGSGKSNCAAVLVEDMFDGGAHVVVIDPVGAWHGLRSNADGSGPGLPIAIFGGRMADLPLEDAAGAFVADLVVEQRLSCVLDTSELSENGKRRFLAEFAERLYRRNEHPLHLVLEEADDYAPQRTTRGNERLLGAWQRIVKRGRFKGLGVTMVTQRSAALNKDLLTQVETLIAFRSPSPQDRKAIQGWIEHHGQSRELLDSLPGLPTGQCWVWSPHWLGTMQRTSVRRRRTFDSGATPHGEASARPSTVADVDVAALKEAMADAIERTKAEDPREMRRRIAALERELQASRSLKSEVETVVERVEVPVLLTDDRIALQDVRSTAVEAMDRLSAHLEEMGRKLTALELVRDALGQPLTATGRPPAHATPTRAIERGRGGSGSSASAGSAPRQDAHASARSPEAGTLPRSEHAILTAAAQHRAGVTREQLTILTGYKRSSRDTYLQRLQARGLVVIVQGRIVATETGAETLGPDFAPLPTGAALRDHWLDRLPEGERRILAELCAAYPNQVARETLSDKTGYKRSSRDTYLQRLRARALIVTVGHWLQASDTLFD